MVTPGAGKSCRSTKVTPTRSEKTSFRPKAMADSSTSMTAMIATTPRVPTCGDSPRPRSASDLAMSRGLLRELDGRHRHRRRGQQESDGAEESRAAQDRHREPGDMQRDAAEDHQTDKPQGALAPAHR